MYGALMFGFAVVYPLVIGIGVIVGLLLRGDGPLGFVKRIGISAACGAAYAALISLAFLGPGVDAEGLFREVTLYVAGVSSMLAALGGMIGWGARVWSKRKK